MCISNPSLRKYGGSKSYGKIDIKLKDAQSLRKYEVHTYQKTISSSEIVSSLLSMNV
jgi:hypothetical protein